jgi:hypothetical protein
LSRMAARCVRLAGKTKSPATLVSVETSTAAAVSADARRFKRADSLAAVTASREVGIIPRPGPGASPRSVDAYWPTPADA